MNTPIIETRPAETIAQVTAVCKDIFEITAETEKGLARIKRSHYQNQPSDYPTTGDYVAVDWRGADQSIIHRTLPRTSSLSRLDSFKGTEQMIAANFNYVMILQSIGHDFNLRRLERYLTLAWQSGAIPLVLLTKIDTGKDYSDQLAAAQKVALGTEVHAISAQTGAGIAELNQYLRPEKTAVLVGSSGVGKSTLINRLLGKEVMATSAIREKDGRGRHTTSHRQLFQLANGAKLIDTPGMREVGMWDVSQGLEVLRMSKAILANVNLTTVVIKANLIAQSKKRCEMASCPQSVGKAILNSTRKRNIRMTKPPIYEKKKFG